MSSELAIKVSNLSKCYQIYDRPRDRLLQMFARNRKQFFREFWALNDISFEVKKGETVGIIGKNGSGKSTLLQMICGTLNPTSGTIHTQGRVAALLELGSGFNPEFTGRENVYMNAAILGLNKEEIDNRFDDISAFADIGEYIDQPTKTYSSGMMVRLAFAVIAHVDADILIVDEALAVGDALFNQKCMRFIRKFREEHSLLFVSHDTSAVTNICDRAIWLHKGEMKALADSKSVCELYLNNLFEGMQKEEANRSPDNKVTQIKRIAQTDLIWRDQRADLIAASNLRNDLEIFKFNTETSTHFGGDEARIINVMLLDSTGCPLHWVVGGEKVCLRIEAELFIDLQSPILGFFVKDRLGQTLFGDNTYLSYASQPCFINAGNKIAAEFDFYMPWLAQGDYIIMVAIANGTQEDHCQLHWIHDALVFHSNQSPLSTGIVGIPMLDIRLMETVIEQKLINIE